MERFQDPDACRGRRFCERRSSAQDEQIQLSKEEDTFEIKNKTISQIKNFSQEETSKPEIKIEAKQKVGEWVKDYNEERLHSAIGFMPPAVWHNGDVIKLREKRKEKL